MAMKKRTRDALGVLVLVSLGVGYLAYLRSGIETPPPDNLVRDASFTEGAPARTPDEEALDEPWAISRDAEHGHTSIQWDLTASDFRALLVEANRPEGASPDGYQATTVRQCIPVDETKRYAVSARFRYLDDPSDRPSNRLLATWHENAECTGYAEGAFSLEPNSTSRWQTLSRDDLAPMIGSKSVSLRIYQRLDETPRQRVLWDHVALTASNTAGGETGPRADETHVRNAGFEKNLEGWTYSAWPRSWSSESAGVTPGSFRVRAISKDGYWKGSAFAQCVVLGPGKEFEAAVNFRRDHASTESGDGIFRVIWYADRNCEGQDRDGGTVKTGAGHQWQQLRISDLVAPARARSAWLLALQEVESAGEHIAYWDDMVLRPADASRSAAASKPPISVEIGRITDRRSTGPFSDFRLELIFSGHALSQAYGVRQTVLDEAVDSTGRDLLPTEPGRPYIGAFDPIDSDRPRISERITLKTPSRLADHARLSGRLEILIPSKDPSSVITIEAIGSKTGKPLDHPRLEEAGIQLMVARPEEARKLADLALQGAGGQADAGEFTAAAAQGFQRLFESLLDHNVSDPDSLTYAIQDPNNRLGHLVALGKDGSPLESSSARGGAGGRRYTVDYDSRPDESTALRIYLATKDTLVQLPFPEIAAHLP